MTLKEFVEDVIKVNNIEADADQIIDYITDIARERARRIENNSISCCIMSNEEIIEMVVNHADLARRQAEEKRLADERKKAEQEAEEKKKQEEKIAREIEKERKVGNGEQTALF